MFKMYIVHVYIVHDYPTKQSTSVYHNIEWMLNEIKKCINKLGRTVLMIFGMWVHDHKAACRIP
jgi:hypothetical protein